MEQALEIHEPHRETVLVVDDEPQVLIALEDLLSDEFIVLKSQSAESALNVVEREPGIAVVVSDQRMPHMQGDELFSRLRRQSSAERILSTGFADLTAVVRAVNDGQIFAYVTKPWDPDDLRVKVQRAVDRFRMARELAHERQLLDDLMSSVPDAIYFKDRELRFRRFNSSFQKLSADLPAEQILGRRSLEVFPDHPLAEETETEERHVLVSGEPLTDKIVPLDVEGRRRWFSVSKAPTRDVLGNVSGLVAIARDFTERAEMEEALRTKEERLRLTFSASSAGLFDWDVSADEVEYSPALAASIAPKSCPTTFAEFEARIHPDDLQRFRALLALHIERREAFRPSELRLFTDGEYNWYELGAQAVWSEQGSAKRVVGSVSKITERKLQEQRIARLTRIHAVLSGINSTILRVSERAALLRESCRIAVRVGELSLAVIAEQSQLGVSPVVAWDGASNLVERLGAWLIDAAAQPGSLVFAAIETRRPAFVNDLKQDDARVALSRELFEAGHRAIAVVPVRVSERIDATLALVADTPGFFDEDQVKLLAELADNIGFALEHKAQAERLDFLAYHDDLTQLPNRRLFTDRLETQLGVSESNRKLAVVMIDIERFRHVNETLGRSAGDQLLLELAGRLKSVSDGKGTLARFASNTFAVVLGQVEDEAAVAQWVEEALLALVKPVTVASIELRLAAKVGISLFPADGTHVDALLANGEAALKKAKAGPHPYLFYTASMNGRVSERLTLETKLRRAIEQQEFLLHYQPKVDFKSGRVVGLEALVRWSPPEGGLISPGLFVPVLEETGLIVRVGEWILERAAAQFTEWSERGLAPPRIAVNVSPHQLGRQDFVRVVERIAEKYPLTVCGVDLEITESVLMEDFQVNTEKLARARNLGLGVAIDDFGTGYSSLGYLRRLPIDALKIDRSFVIRMHEDPQEMSIVTTIISLAHSLDLKVVAEGVETLQQAQLLRLLKCDQAQGYLLAKPQSAADVEPLLSRVFDLSGRAT